MPKRKPAKEAKPKPSRKTRLPKSKLPAGPPVPKSFAKLPAELSWAGDAWNAAHTLLDGIERNLQLHELAKRPGGVQIGGVDTSFFEEMEQAFQTMKRIDPSVDLQGMDLLTLRRELLWIVSKLKMLPNAAKGEGIVRHADSMRIKRDEKSAAIRAKILEEGTKRIKKNPGLKEKPTTLRDVLYSHFLRNGKQRAGYGKTTIWKVSCELCSGRKLYSPLASSE